MMRDETRGLLNVENELAALVVKRKGLLPLPLLLLLRFRGRLLLLLLGSVWVGRWWVVASSGSGSE